MVNAPETQVEATEVSKPETVTTGLKKVETKEIVKDVDEAPTEAMNDDEKSAALEKALEKLAAGKKSLIQNLPQQAVEELADACSLQSSVHGDMSQTMCEFYYYYGRALLDVARIEDTVLGNALTGVPEGDDVDNSQVEDPDKLSAEEKEDVAQKVDEALEANYIDSSKKESGEKKEGESSKQEDKKEEKEDKKEEKESKNDETEEKEDKKAEKEDETKEKEIEKKEEKDDDKDKVEEPKEKSEEAMETEEKEQEEAHEDEGEGEEEEEEGGDDTADESQEDVPSLQLAWEVLELAKTIYEKSEKKSDDEILKLSQVYLKLGEVCLENENYPESINMYSECLKLQVSILSADDRWLAETHYQLGLAYSLADNFDEAVKHIQSAIDVIEQRIKNVVEKLKKEEVEFKDDMEVSSLSDEQKTFVNDVKELKKLLPELQEKLTDIKDTKASYTEKLKALKKMDVETQFSSQLSGGSSSKSAFDDGASTSSATPIATSLIRKKRKPEDEAASEGVKKPRTEASNGAKEAANGDDKQAKPMES